MSQQTVKEMEVKHEEIGVEGEKESRSRAALDKKSYRDKAIERRLNKKIICPLHKEKYILRCLDEGCGRPFACSQPACIYAHQHQQRMVFQKFDGSSLRKSLERAQKIIGNNETLFDKARQIKHVIDGLKNTLTDLFKDLGTLSEVCGDLKSQVDLALTSSYLGRIDEVTVLEAKILATLQTMKSKVMVSEEMPEFYLRNEVSLFLEQNVPNFRMETAKEVVSIDRTTIESVRFEQLLAGRAGLVFLILCDYMVMGSYCHVGYPGREERIRDEASFIFLTDGETENRIVKFKANPDCKWHFQTVDRYVFSHGRGSEQNEGLLISEANPMNIDFLLPSAAYISDDLPLKTYSGSLNWRRLIVLQAQ